MRVHDCPDYERHDDTGEWADECRDTRFPARWFVAIMLLIVVAAALTAWLGCARDYSQLADLRYERVDEHTIRVHDHTGPAYLIQD